MKQLTVLVCPINYIGHVNACLGTTSAFVSRGHRVVFVVESAWSGKLAPKYGVTEHLYSVPSQTGKQTAELNAKEFLTLRQLGPYSPKEKIITLGEGILTSEKAKEQRRYYNAAIKSAIDKYKPDVIITDENGLMPAIYCSNVPWIRHLSCNPLFFELEEDLPPGGSGLPLDDRSAWADFNNARTEILKSKSFNDLIESMGYERYPNDVNTPRTAILTIYATPEEWNYPPLKQKADWFNIEVFNKKKVSTDSIVSLKKILPKSFIDNKLNGNFSGKYIYVSLGSMGSIDLNMMKRLLSALENSPHKYIVSKGPLHEQYEVAGENQWGAQFLPQLDILPQVDLIITHGGNNSITEIFALGKPLIVMPLFADQFDNAQRLQETGFAVKLDPYNFTADQLNETVEQILDNKKLLVKLEAAAKRIQASNTHQTLVDLVESKLSNKAN